MVFALVSCIMISMKAELMYFLIGPEDQMIPAHIRNEYPKDYFVGWARYYYGKHTSPYHGVMVSNDDMLGPEEAPI